MSNDSTKPIYVTLHRLGELSGRSRGLILLRMRDDELVPDAYLDLGGRRYPLFALSRAADIKKLPSRKKAPAINPML